MAQIVEMLKDKDRHMCYSVVGILKTCDGSK